MEGPKVFSTCFALCLVANGASAAVPPPTPYATSEVMFVVAAADGTVASGSNITGVIHLDSGAYQVDMRHDVTGCAYVATIGLSAPNDPPVGFATTAPRGGNPSSVFVATFNSAGTMADQPFHLMVTC